MTWKEWMDYHATMFGLSGEENMKMLRSWFKLFSGAGYTTDELKSASDYVALGSQPKYPADHRALLVSRLKVMRGSPVYETPPERIGCSECRYSGHVDVPSLDWFNGRTRGIYRPSCSVYCRCETGVSLHRQWVLMTEQANAENPTLYRADVELRSARQKTIDHYESVNPNWRAQVQKQKEQSQTMTEVREAESIAAVRFGPLISRLKHMQKTPVTLKHPAAKQATA